MIRVFNQLSTLGKAAFFFTLSIGLLWPLVYPRLGVAYPLALFVGFILGSLVVITFMIDAETIPFRLNRFRHRAKKLGWLQAFQRGNIAITTIHQGGKRTYHLTSINTKTASDVALQFDSASGLWLTVLPSTDWSSVANVMGKWRSIADNAPYIEAQSLIAEWDHSVALANGRQKVNRQPALTPYEITERLEALGYRYDDYGDKGRWVKNE